MSFALAKGMIGAGLAITAGGFALAAAFARDRFMSLVVRTEVWRDRAGLVLEIGGSILVVMFGVSTLLTRWAVKQNS